MSAGGSTRIFCLRAVLMPLLAACGGGGGDGQPPPPSGPPTINHLEADRSSHIIGERARVAACFSHGTARLQPGALVVQSGQIVDSTPFARAEHAAVRLTDGRVLIFGDEDAGSVLPSLARVFDPNADTFEQFSAELGTGRVGFLAVSFYDGNVLTAGGELGLGG